jgi:hypothetical protein
MARDRERAAVPRAWDTPDEPEKLSFADRLRVFYARRPRLVTTVAMAVVLGGAAVGIVVYREDARQVKAMDEIYAVEPGAPGALEQLAALELRYGDTEAAPLILFKKARHYQERGDLDSLQEALKFYNEFASRYGSHVLYAAADEAVKTILMNIDYLKAGHQEATLAHTLRVHPEVIAARVNPPARSHLPAEPDLDAEMRAEPRALPEPVVLMGVEDGEVELRLFPEEAPEIVGAFLNDVRINALSKRPLTRDTVNHSYRFASGPARTAGFTPARSGRAPELGTIAVELDPQGRPILNAYLIFYDSNKENLAPLKDRMLVFGRVTSAMSHLAVKVKPGTEIGAVREMFKRPDLGTGIGP